MKNLVLIIVALVGLNSIVAQKALEVGSVAPDFKAITQNGEKIKLSEVVKEKRVVLMFYRGQWCPFCNKQISELQDSLELIKDKNAIVLAVTPEKQTEIDKTIKKTSATFDIIYDKNHKIMDAYNVTFQLPKVQRVAYKAWGIDINKASGNDDFALPVPATYIIDTDGKIMYAFFDDNYKERATVAELLEALDEK